jgi:hypothetical protein
MTKLSLVIPECIILLAAPKEDLGKELLYVPYIDRANTVKYRDDPENVINKLCNISYGSKLLLHKRRWMAMLYPPLNQITKKNLSFPCHLSHSTHQPN